MKNATLQRDSNLYILGELIKRTGLQTQNKRNKSKYLISLLTLLGIGNQ